MRYEEYICRRKVCIKISVGCKPDNELGKHSAGNGIKKNGVNYFCLGNLAN